ncbi:hypothetical protein E1285_40190 [Actinomadura sp. 7K507]|nr:hypothetical protein E1285_40190 [Actinomadura sp. 7K507]
MRLIDGTGAPIDPAIMSDTLATSGVVFIRDGDLPTLIELLLTFSELYHHPHEDSVGITRIEGASSASTIGHPGRQAFSRDALPLHTDRAMVAAPPTLATLLTVQAPAQGGEALLADLAPAIHRLTRLPDLAEACRSAVLVSADRQAPVLEPLGPAGYRFRYRNDAIARSRLLSSCGWPVLEELRKLRNTPRVVRMSAGDGYIVHNHRYLHGRRSFSGDRQMIRLLASSDIPVITAQALRTHGG